MALGRHGIRNMAVILGVVVVVAVLIAVFVLPASPHFGFVSEQQTNKITHQNFTSSQSSTSSSSNSTSGEKKSESVQYYAGTQSVTITVVEYNSSAMASKDYANFTQILSASFHYSLTGASLHNSSYRGFTITYGYVNASLLNLYYFFAAGFDGSYLFIIFGLLSSGNFTDVSALADAQVSAML
jgi:hypothetical protein